MRTKRFATTAVAMLMMLAIIGTGFSYWFFQTTNQANASQTPSTDVTQLVAVGSVAAADNFTIRFDQTADGRTNNGNSVSLGGNDKTEGIKLVFADAANTKAVYTHPTTDTGVDATEDDKIGYTFTVTVTVSEALAAYFDMSTSDSAWTKTRSAASEGKVTITFVSETTSHTELADTEFDWAAVTCTYTVADTDKEPKNATEYNTFKAIVENTSNTVEVAYNVTVTSIVA